MEVAVLLLVSAVTLLIWWLRRVYTFWQSKGVVQAPTVPGFGNYLDAFLGRTNPGLVADRVYRSFPDNDAVGMYSLLKPALLVRSPDLVKQVMASDFTSFHDADIRINKQLDPLLAHDPFFVRGEGWKQSRNKLVFFLSQSRMKQIFPLMKESVERMDEYIKKQLGKNVDAKELSTMFAMDNVSSCAFGLSSNCYTDSEAPFRKMGDILMNDDFQSFWKNVLYALLPEVRDLLGLRIISKGVADHFKNMILDLKKQRLTKNIVRNDLMHHIINKSVSDEELLGHAFVFFLEGFESSSIVASSALYELALNPKVQETLYDELKQAFSSSADFEFDTVWSLPYLEKVIQETMRKYPIAYVYGRTCTKDTTMKIDGKQVEIKKGTLVKVPIYSLHYDPQHYPDPQMFDPERFSEGEVAARTPCTYMPLGEGPRICVGFRFGMIQVKLFIAQLVLKYRILRTENTPTTLTLDKHSLLTLHVERKWIALQPRD